MVIFKATMMGDAMIASREKTRTLTRVWRKGRKRRRRRGDDDEEEERKRRETYNHSTLLGRRWGSHVGAGPPLDTHQCVRTMEQDKNKNQNQKAGNCAELILVKICERPLRITEFQSLQLWASQPAVSLTLFKTDYFSFALLRVSGELEMVSQWHWRVWQ
jgi:hypothetical protein